jgi:hypothetical protein
LNGRLIKAKQHGELSEEQVIQEGSPIRKLSGLFPNSPLAKNTPFDIFLTAPQEGKPRALIFRDFGSVESDWVATNFVLNYLGPECPSPAVSFSMLYESDANCGALKLKETVLKNMADFEK